MKKVISIILFPFLLLLACNNEENKINLHMSGETNEKEANFDLYKLTFKEKINQILTLNNTNLKDCASEELTLFGFERLESSSRSFMIFNGVVLFGSNKEKSNKVIIHYSEKDSLISMYEIKLFSANEIKALLISLNSLLGKPIFFSKSSGIENQNMEYSVWDNPEQKQSYFLIHNIANENSSLELTVVGNKNDLNDWIKFRSFEWYKK